MPRAAELAAKRQALLLRGAALRQTLALQAEVLRRPLALADQGRAGLAWLKRHPEVPIGAAVLLLVLRPRRVWQLATAAWWGWRGVQNLRRQLDR